MFEEEYNHMPDDDKKAFAKVVNDLMLKGFIVRDQFDAREKAMRINPDFRFVERYLEVISEYLSLSGWVLEKDALNGVAVLSNTLGQNRLRLDRETSLVIFTLRLIYETEKSASSQPGESLYLTTPALMKSMMDHGIVFPGKKLTGRLLAKPLRFLANHAVIAKVSGNYDEGNVSFYLLPSIIYAVDNQKIAAMSEAIDKQTGIERGDEE
jgi:hypothetical protein